MVKLICTYHLWRIFLGVVLLAAMPVMADGTDVLERIIQFEKSKKTVYQLLNEVSVKTGCLFVYDSKLIDNERTVRLRRGERTVKEAIYEIIDNRKLEIRVVGNHILILNPSVHVQKTGKTKKILLPDSSSCFTVEGTLLDKYSQEPISYGTVSLLGTSIGSVANQNGAFRLLLSDSLRNKRIRFSHIGYESLEIESECFNDCVPVLTLEPKIVPIQEIIIRIADPLRLLREMFACRERNYSQHPVYLTTFYREGIERNRNKFVSLTEAVFKIYKSPYQKEANLSDQVKLLKMRSITSDREKDTLIAKMRSGIDASLQLDLIKSIPDFFMFDSRDNVYVYASSDLAVIDGRIANVVHFEQRRGTREPYYCGDIYIDTENNALLKAQFEINPAYVGKAADMLVRKKSRNMKIVPQKVIYSVSYKRWENTYYINHVRGDLHFKVKHKRPFFNSSSLHTWFEMVTCKIDTVQVERFPRREKQPVHSIFSDTQFKYDKEFWRGFNVIPPEEELSKSIENITTKIEETF